MTQHGKLDDLVNLFKMGTNLFMCAKIVLNSNGMTSHQIRNNIIMLHVCRKIIQWHKMGEWRRGGVVLEFEYTELKNENAKCTEGSMLCHQTSHCVALLMFIMKSMLTNEA